ncbi:MAG: ABC transporter permease [Gammaproteobacteria bacterium]|nr:ABC transporter permease [Gammaproteobacteria bacterium]
MTRLVLAIMKKEFLQLRRDPRLIAFILFFPVVLVLLFGLALKLEPENVRMAYVDQDPSLFSNLIKTNIWSEGYFTLYEVEDEAAIRRAIRLGEARAGLLIPRGFSAELTENAQPTVRMFVDGTMPSLATAMDNKKHAITDDAVTGDMYFLDPDADNVVIAPEPFHLDVEVLFNPDKKETWFFLPGVVGVLIMQVALILTGTAVVREKENHTLEQLIVSPLSKSGFVAGKTLPYVLIALADFYLVLALSTWLFGLPFPGSAQWPLLVLALLYVGGLIALGLAISTISQTQQQAIFLSIFFLIPSILLSGFIFPVEAMPSYVQPIAWVLPFTYFIEVIRGLLLKGNGIADLYPHYLALLGFAAGFIALSIARFRRYLD